MKKRLWIVSEVYYPDETSTGYYMTAIAEGLADRFEVKVLCGQPNYSARGTRALKHEFRNGTEVFRAGGTRFNRTRIPFRVVNMLTLGGSVLLNALLRFKRGDLVMVVTTPPNMPFIVAMASLVRGSQYNLLIHDRYPDELVAVGMLGHGSFTVRLIEFFNRWLYKHAARMIVVGRDMKELIEQKSKALDVPIALIPNWAEIEDVHPQPRAENVLLRKLGLTNKLVVLHAGNIGHPTDVETIIDAMREVRGEDFHFIFLGSGVKLKKLESAKRKLGLENLTLLPPRPRSEQPDFLNACDVGLVSLVKGMYGAAMPSKTYNIMAAGKPILALTDDRSELARVIDEENIGWHIPPGDSAELVKLLRTISEHRDMFQEMGTRAREAALCKYSLQTAIEKYATELGK